MFQPKIAIKCIQTSNLIVGFGLPRPPRILPIRFQLIVLPIATLFRRNPARIDPTLTMVIPAVPRGDNF